MKYDAIIVGAGPAGVFTAYELKEKGFQGSILLLEKGAAIEKRKCPKASTGRCVHCKPCHITTGFSGAGAFSDGKYVISTEYGGWLTEFLEPETVIDYIEQADSILVKFGATTERFMPNNELKLECLKHEIKVVCGRKVARQMRMYLEAVLEELQFMDEDAEIDKELLIPLKRVLEILEKEDSESEGLE